MADLSDRLVACTLPGTAWLCVFLSHYQWAVESLNAGAEDLPSEDRLNVARQLLTLYEAAKEGAPPSLDDVVTEQREMLNILFQRLGYQPTKEDYEFAEQLVLRDEDLRSLIRKLVGPAP